MHVHAMRAYARGRGPLLPLGVVDLVKESCFAISDDGAAHVP